MPKDDRKRVSERQERGLARRTGAKLHSGSGSGHTGHDMHTDGELIECKTVLKGNRQITIKADDLKSLSYQAAIQDKDPLLHVELDGRRWVLIPEENYLGP